MILERLPEPISLRLEEIHEAVTARYALDNLRKLPHPLTPETQRFVCEAFINRPDPELVVFEGDDAELVLVALAYQSASGRDPYMRDSSRFMLHQALIPPKDCLQTS